MDSRQPRDAEYDDIGSEVYLSPQMREALTSRPPEPPELFVSLTEEPAQNSRERHLVRNAVMIAAGGAALAAAGAGMGGYLAYRRNHR
ncbi:MAG TPA: hypothetical protein VFW52_00085 [Candidatus Saccharimonadales bacterium]|nr:hypothetical protein [Candidatus Saccharimonadales bacterium]